MGIHFALQLAKRIGKEGLSIASPIVPGYRTQPNGKVRMVHMYPTDMCLFEMRYSYKVAEILKGNEFPFTYGLDVDTLGSKLYKFCEARSLSIDFSRFDTTVPLKLVKRIFREMGKKFANYTAERDF